MQRRTGREERDAYISRRFPQLHLLRRIRRQGSASFLTPFAAGLHDATCSPDQSQSTTTRNTAMHHMSPDIEECIRLCLSCHHVCYEAAMNQCLDVGGKHLEPQYFRLMMNCAEICQTCANFMLSGSDLHHLTCGVCAEVCRRCAEECERMGDMEECAETCRNCAEACADMAESSPRSRVVGATR